MHLRGDSSPKPRERAVPRSRISGTGLISSFIDQNEREGAAIPPGRNESTAPAADDFDLRLENARNRDMRRATCLAAKRVLIHAEPPGLLDIRRGKPRSSSSSPRDAPKRGLPGNRLRTRPISSPLTGRHRLQVAGTDVSKAGLRDQVRQAMVLFRDGQNNVASINERIDPRRLQCRLTE